MKIISKKIVSLSVLVFLCLSVFAQEDMLSLLDSDGGKKTHDKTIATFKDSKIINVQTTETVKKGTTSFNISHRFGNIGVASNGGGHTLYGLDNITDVRIGFDFGITDNLTLGIGRSKQGELIDALAKYRILSQTTDNHVPFSLAFYGCAGYNPQLPLQFYNGMAETLGFQQKTEYRFSYVGQLIIARKFGWRLSLELLPTYMHRNFVVANVNPANGAKETNDLMSIGGGARFKISQRVAIIADYYYTFSEYRMNNPNKAFFSPLGLGIEIDTGGHIFHLTFTNCAGIIENNYLPNTTDNWLKGGFKFGFNVSRVFNLGHKKVVKP